MTIGCGAGVRCASNAYILLLKQGKEMERTVEAKKDELEKKIKIHKVV